MLEIILTSRAVCLLPAAKLLLVLLLYIYREGGCGFRFPFTTSRHLQKLWQRREQLVTFKSPAFVHVQAAAPPTPATYTHAPHKLTCTWLAPTTWP